MSAARGHVSVDAGRRVLMPRSEFPPAPKSVRLFPVPTPSVDEVPKQVDVCTTTQPSCSSFAIRVVMWAAIGASLAVVLVWSGVLKHVSQFVVQLFGQPGN